MCQVTISSLTILGLSLFIDSLRFRATCKNRMIFWFRPKPAPGWYLTTGQVLWISQCDFFCKVYDGIALTVYVNNKKKKKQEFYC